LDSERRTRFLLGSLGFGAIALLLALEFGTEADGVSFAEAVLEILELTLTVGAAVAISLLASRLHAEHAEKLELLRELDVARSEGSEWRREVQSHMDGLGAAIEKQFETWGLTSAERAIGLLMLKGFAHKEVAALRGTSEATVRQQARRIYQKANLPGRSGFCAYFLEDLLPGGTPTPER
jgi:DNA-binding NarL/FixJ family response regulator